MFEGRYFEAVPIFCLSETVPRAVASLHLSCSRSHQAALTGVLFLFSLSFLLCLLCGVFKGKLVLFPPLFIFHRLFLLVNPWIFISFSGLLQSKPVLSRVLSQLVPVLATSACSGWRMLGLAHARVTTRTPQGPSISYFPLHLEYSLISGTTKCSRSSCAFLAPVLEAAASPGNCSSALWFIGKWYLWC